VGVGVRVWHTEHSISTLVVHSHTHTHTHTHTHMCVCVRVRVRVCACVCVLFVCVYVYTYVHVLTTKHAHKAHLDMRTCKVYHYDPHEGVCVCCSVLQCVAVCYNVLQGHLDKPHIFVRVSAGVCTPIWLCHAYLRGCVCVSVYVCVFACVCMCI